MVYSKTSLNFAYADKTTKHKNDNVVEDYFIKLIASFPLKHNKHYFGLRAYEKKEENYTYTFCASDIPNDIVPLERVICMRTRNNNR